MTAEKGNFEPTALDAPVGESDVSPRYSQHLDGSIDIARLYTQQSARTERLSAADEVELAHSIEAGLFAREKLEKALESDEALPPQLRADLQQLVKNGQRDMDRFIEANTQLVIWAVRCRPQWDFQEAIQEGNLALIHAVQRFDYRRGFKFSTHAGRLLLRAVARRTGPLQNTIYIPEHVQQKLAGYKHERQELQTKLGRKPTPEELAEAIGISVEQMVSDFASAVQPISLDQEANYSQELPKDDTRRRTRIDTLAVSRESSTIYDTLEVHELREKIIALAAQVLTEQELAIMQLRYRHGELVGATEVCRQLGITAPVILREEKRYLSKLAHPTARLDDVVGKDLGKWRQEARCKQTAQTALFFPRAETKHGDVAKKICEACPGKADCLQFALQKDIPYGIWGGLSTKERRAMRQAAESTPDQPGMVEMETHH